MSEENSTEQQATRTDAEASACVYYDKQDYAGLARRYAAFLIDIGVIFTVWTVLYSATCAKYVPPDILKIPPSKERSALINEHVKPVGMQISLAWLAFCVVYHIPLRRTRFGTVGYIITRMRLVDETGNPPPWKRLIKRFLIALPLCMPLGLFYLACRKQERKQTIHDQLSGTWLVRASAEPAGRAKIAYQTKLLGTYLLTYIDVEPDEPADVGTSPEGAENTAQVEEHAATI